MALREAVGAEALDLPEGSLGELGVIAAGSRAPDELFPSTVLHQPALRHFFPGLASRCFVGSSLVPWFAVVGH